MLIVVEYQRGTDLTFLGQTDIVIPAMLPAVAVFERRIDRKRENSLLRVVSGGRAHMSM
jgi:hypothetical protein